MIPDPAVGPPQTPQTCQAGRVDLTVPAGTMELKQAPDVRKLITHQECHGTGHRTGCVPLDECCSAAFFPMVR